MRLAISRTWGRCSRMSLSRSLSLSASGGAHSLYGWAIKPLLLSGRGGRGRTSRCQDQFHESCRAGSLQIFRDTLARGQERDRLPGARGLVENWSERTGLVRLGEEKPLRMEDVEGVDHAREIARLHGTGEDQLRIDVLSRSEKLRQVGRSVEIAETETRGVDEDQLFAPVLFDRLREGRD